MKKGILASLLAATVAGSLLAGCGGGGGASSAAPQEAASGGTAASSSEAAAEAAPSEAAAGGEITLRVAWWGNQLRNDITTKALELYTQQNPNVKFQTEFTDWTGYWDKMATQAAAGSMPDIVQQDYAYYKQYVTKGQLADLTPYVDSGALKLDDCSQSILDAGKIDGKLYALCLGINAPAMIYDKEAVQEAGVEIKNGMTVSQVQEASKVIFEKTGKKMDWGYGDGDNIPSYLIRGKGKVLMEDGKLGVESAEELVPIFQMYLDSIDGGYSLSAEELNASVGVGLEQDPLALGKSWMGCNYSNQLAPLNAAAGKQLGMVTWPVGDDDTQKAMYLKPSQFFSVAATSQNPEECAKVLDFFTNSVEANDILLAERGVPISTKVAEAIKPKMDENNQQVFDYIAEVEPLCSTINPPNPEGTSEVYTLLNDLYEQVAYKSMTPQQAAEKLFTDGNAILAKAAA